LPPVALCFEVGLCGCYRLSGGNKLRNYQPRRTTPQATATTRPTTQLLYQIYSGTQPWSLRMDSETSRSKRSSASLPSLLTRIWLKRPWISR